MNDNKPLILVDGSSYLYRAFHAMPNLTNSAGEPTGAAYGVVNMLRRMLSEQAPSHAAVVFDAKGKTFRDDIYPEYKANRPPMPDDLRRQIEPIHALVRAMGLPLVVIEGVEADDVIGTLARQCAAVGRPVLISTGDKDMAQLVDEHVILVNTMTDSVSDRAAVIEKFGVPPECIIDYLALMGDSVDNIPGVPGVGPKTAAKWLNEYGSLDGIIENAAKIGGKVGDNLRAHLHQLPLARQLATIKCDVALDFGADDLALKPADNEALRELYARMEFKTWLNENLKASGDSSAASAAAAPVASGGIDRSGYEIITTQERFDAWLKKLEAAPLFSFDTETTALEYLDARIVGLSFAVARGEAAYVPLAHDYLGVPAQLDREAVLAALKPLLESDTRKIVLQNAKYDMHVLANHGIRLTAVAHDTMLESYVVNSVANRHDMDTLSLKYLSHAPIAFTDIAGKGKGQLTFNQIEIAVGGEYAAEDADVTLALHEVLWPKLEGQAGLENIYANIEVPLIPVLAHVEENGVLIDAKVLREQSAQLEKRIAELEQEAYALAGGEFNLSSPKQLAEIFFEKLGMPIVKKTPTGQPSTAEEVLEELALDFPLPKLILEHRGLSKLKSTYTDKLPEQIHPKTGRVHTSYQQAVAATGRLSSTDPNLQNIPIRTEEGRRVRTAFIAPPGYKIVAADYSQIELRIMAHLSGDEGLLHAFRHDIDVHKATAAEIFGIPVSEVSSEQRRSAKAINFGLIYGMSAFGLARQLDIARDAAQTYMHRYFARYPGVEAYMNRIRVEAAERGYVETLFGRRLYLPDIKSSNQGRRKAAERTAINAPMQGTAADIIKRAMLAVHDWIGRSELDVKMVMQVHDELVFEVRADQAEAASAKIRELMSGAAELAIPLVVEAGIGDNWDQAH